MTIHTIRTPQDRALAVETLLALNLDHPWDIEIKRRRERRTLSQNALMWKWIGEVVKHVRDFTGYETDEIHEYLKQRFLPPAGRKMVIIGGVTKEHLSTTKLNIAEMSEYMDTIYRWATSELGLILPLPDELHERAALEMIAAAEAGE